MSAYHFWEKTSEDISRPSTQEEPRSEPATTPSTPSAPEAAPDPHAEDKHKLDLESQEQAMQHKQELHEQRMRHTEELHSVKMQSSGVSGGAGGAQGAQEQAAPPMDPQQAQMASQSNLLANYIQAKMGEAACATPGEKKRSKGKGRGLAIGEGKGPLGRMAEQRKAAEESPEEEEAAEAEGNPVTLEQVREFLRQNQAPEDYELHQWAESQGISPHAAEELIYQLAAQQVTGKPPEDTVEGGPEEGEEKEGSVRERFFKVAKELIRGGMADNVPDQQYPKKQIDMGVKVEKEHTPNATMAKEIAKDHLEESPVYYTELAKMEKKLEAKGEKRAQWHDLKKEIAEHLKAHS